MPRATATWTISLPPAFAREAEAVSKREHRTRSELVREALRTYLGARALPTYTPTARELRAIQKGRQSPSMSLDDFFAHVERLAAKGRRQNGRSRTRKGA